MSDLRNLLFDRLERQPRQPLGQTPTPIEALPNLAAALGLRRLAVKRDDLTGLGFGGNKVRQLESYFGAALAQKADVVLITGAVQSNYARLAAAAARQLGLECHIQLEARVERTDRAYQTNGNVLLDRLLGATLHRYPEGEDEAGADRALQQIAARLCDAGRRPYVIPLGPGNPPLGALGYIRAAAELVDQLADGGADPGVEEIIVTSGSGITHAGLLYGLRALGSRLKVTGICARRDAAAQAVQQAGWVPPPRAMESGSGIGVNTVIVAFILGCLVPVVAYVGTLWLVGPEQTTLQNARTEMPAPEPVTEPPSDKGKAKGKSKGKGKNK